MAIELRMPLLGDIMREGTIAAWLEEDQAWVRKGQPLFSVETDKAVVDVEAPATGRLQQLVRAGETIAVGGRVGLIAPEGESSLETPSATPPSREAAAPAPAQPPPAPEEQEREVRASPLARRLAREHRVELSQVHGTGPGGRIVEADVHAYLQALREAAPAARSTEPVGLAASATGVEAGRPATVPLRGRRRVIADRMLTSLQSTAQLTIGQEVDVTRVVDLRNQLVELWEQSESIRVTYTDVILKAAALALRDHRRLNATIVGDEIHLLPEINVALAIDVEEGLTVPVVRSADRRPLLELARDVRRLTELARAGKLKPDDLAGATFTISAMGSYNVDWFTPILSPPQVAILGIGRIRSWPALTNGQLAERRVLNLCLTFDHRALDGGPAARFLDRIAALLQTPIALL